jgi:glycosyltransferase involved in cell wall biosynthesis
VTTRHFAQTRGSGAAGRAVAAVARHRVAAQISISRYVADAVDGPSVVVHPGVDSAPDAPPAGARDRTVLVAQRLESEKETDVAVRAFAASGLAGAGWRLRVAGDGARRAELEALTARLGIATSTDFLGQRHDVPALLETAAILLAPCSVEGLGLSVLEAMSHGLPVVAARAGGHVELLDGLGANGLFTPGAPDDAARLLRALANDPEARDAYGAAEQARQRTDFTLDAQVQATDAVYRGVL